ncbi:hypothetical protein [Buchnera aphidicola]|nr:hypothetical protein [Buchnera aphidicola]
MSLRSINLIFIEIAQFFQVISNECYQALLSLVRFVISDNREILY